MRRGVTRARLLRHRRRSHSSNTTLHSNTTSHSSNTTSYRPPPRSNLPVRHPRTRLHKAPCSRGCLWTAHGCLPHTLTPTLSQPSPSSNTYRRLLVAVALQTQSHNSPVLAPTLRPLVTLVAQCQRTLVAVGVCGVGVVLRLQYIPSDWW